MTFRLLLAPLGAAALFALGGLPGVNATAVQGISLSLPWEGGTSWLYIQGPHGGLSSPVLDALDFQPPDAVGKSCESFVSSYWVVAAADGEVYSIPNGIEIDHGNGFRTGYFHLADKQVETGRVKAGERLGRPSCCPDGGTIVDCFSTAPHLHFYTSYNGVRQPIVGINVGGWSVNPDGCLTKNGRKACPQTALVSNAPRVSGHRPSTPADVVFVIDTSSSMRGGDVQSTIIASLRAFQRSSSPEDRVGVVTFDSSARVIRPLAPMAPLDGLAEKLEPVSGEDASAGATDIAAGLRAACRHLQTEGQADVRVAVLISDGRHNARGWADPTGCYSDRGWPLFVYGVGAGNSVFLSLLAERSGGEYRDAEALDNVVCEMQRLRTRMTNETPYPCDTYRVREGEMLFVPLEVPPEQARAVFSVEWSGASQGDDVRLVAPAGWLVDPDDSPYRVTNTRDVGLSVHSIEDPPNGVWAVYVPSSSVPRGGALVTFSLTTVPRPSPLGTSPPTADDGGAREDAAPAGTPAPDSLPSSGPSAESAPPASDEPAPEEEPSPTPTLEPTPEPTAESTPEPAPVKPVPTPIKAPTPTPVKRTG